MNAPIHRPGSVAGLLPAFCALAPAVGCLSYGAAILVVGSRIGNQGSTAGIAAGLALVAIAPLVIMGLQLGRLLARLLPPTLTGRPVGVAWPGMPILLALVAALAWRAASAPLYAAQLEARPRIIIDAAGLDRSTGQLPAAGVTRGSRVLHSPHQLDGQISWNEGNVLMVNRGDVLELRFDRTGQSVNIPLPGIGYITCVDSVVLEAGPEVDPALALLVTGRATGRRDLLAVVSAGAGLVHLELLDRFWDFRRTPLSTTMPPMASLIYVGSEPANQLVFAATGADG